MKAHEGDITKLPKWAQTKIEVLEMRLREARERIAGESVEGSVVFARPYSDYPKPLGDADVEFRVEDYRFKVGIRENKLEVYSNEAIVVEPRASNVVLIQKRPR